MINKGGVQFGAPIFRVAPPPHTQFSSHPEPEKGALREAENEFHISSSGVDSPGEPLRGRQIFAADRIEGRWERNFLSILAFT